MLAMVAWKVLSAHYGPSLQLSRRYVLVLLFGHYLEQLGNPNHLISEYRPYFFQFIQLFRSVRDVGM